MDALRKAGDSCGARIRVQATGVPVGLGEPLYDKLDADIAFPVEWFQALRWGLADELCSGQPQLIMERCERKAMMYRDLLEDWDVEDTSTRVTPDMSGIAPSRFQR